MLQEVLILRKIPHKVLSTLLWEKSYVEGFNQYFS